jgi:hypothetical protein
MGDFMKSHSVIFVLLFSLAVAGASLGQPAITENGSFALKSIDYYSRALAFTQNDGQFGEETRFRAEAGGATIFLCDNEVAYLFSRDTDELLDDGITGARELPHKFNRPRYKKEFTMLKAHFIGANEDVEVIGEELLSQYNNYFLGNDPAEWRTDVPNYESITYRNIYPGIDLKYYGDGKSLKYDFIVHPGADPSSIEIHYEGAEELNVNASGDLEAVTEFGPAFEKTPYIYQIIDGVKHEISGRYELKSNGSFGFALNDVYNPSHPLIIDPELVFSSYLGGESVDNCSCVAVDSDGCVYIAGETNSYYMPVYNAFQDEFQLGMWDGYIAKFSPLGHTLIYCTYLGGRNDELLWDIDIDSNDNLCITGQTWSQNFPIFNAYLDHVINFSSMGFITKFVPAGNSLVFSTYFGGSGGDACYALDQDDQDHIYVAGPTASSDFPMVNPIFGVLNNSTDGFVSKFSPDCLNLLFSTYIGGSNNDQIYDLKIDNFGGIHIAGTTYSEDFPLIRPPLPQYGTDRDGFAAKISPSLDSLDYSTYIGGNSTGDAFCIDADSDGNSFIGGWVWYSIPLQNPIDSIRAGAEGFILGIYSYGDSIIFGTYFGGSSVDMIRDIYVQNDGSIHVTGFTRSDDIPLSNPYDDILDGEVDCLIATISGSRDSLIFGTYFGGSADEDSYGIEVNGSGDIYVSGFTSSTDFPVVNACFGSYNDAQDAFFAKFGTTFPCAYVVGDANASGETNGLDVIYLVNYFKGGSPPPVSCDCPPYGMLYLGADSNGSCSVNGLDVSYLVNILKGTAVLYYCSDCPPNP